MTLDQQLEFLRIEIRNLKERTEAWAVHKVKSLEAIAETVRIARQNESMTSKLTGRHIA